MSTATFNDALKTACAEVGIVYQKVPADGRFHSTDIEGDSRGRGDGRIKLFTDGTGGIVRNWKGEQRTFFFNDGRTLTDAERRDRNRKRADAIRQAREDEEQRRAEAQAKAKAIWKRSTSALPDHPYLIRKCVSPVATLREIDAGAAAAILGYTPKSKGEPLSGRLLVALVKVGNKVSTAELIDEAGRKSAIAGGAKAGGYWASQALPGGTGAGLTLQIGEGVATVLSANEATGNTGIAALSCGNLSRVAKAIHQRYPAATLVILADLGNGQKDAEEAARSVDGMLAIPDFGTNRPEGAKDFNDMAVHCGVKGVRVAIARAICSDWQEPLPLVATTERVAYPLDALPNPIHNAVEEVRSFIKAPVALVATSAVAAVSVATQAQVDVKRAEKLAGPVGLFTLTIADSGERKTTSDDFFSESIRNYDQEQAELAKPEQERHAAAIAAWTAEHEGILLAVKQAAKSGKPANGKSVDALREDLVALEQNKPKAPRVPRLMRGDDTPENLAYVLSRECPSAGVLTAEAGVIFGAHAMSKDVIMRNLSRLNILWDGGELFIGRRTSESFTVRGARLTMGLQVQETTLRSFFDRSSGLARGTGFLARFLLAWPESTQGFRPFTDPPEAWPSLTKFNSRITEILKKPVQIDEEGALCPKMLSLTPGAKAAWVSFHDTIEAELRNGGELFDVRDVASKTADNAARVAALFHVFSHGMDSDVCLECFEGALRIAAWHLNESRRFFGELALPKELTDPARLIAWLIEYCRRERTQIVPRREVQRCGPNGLRERVALDQALRELTDSAYVRVIYKRRRKEIHLNPVLIERGPS